MYEIQEKEDPGEGWSAALFSSPNSLLHLAHADFRWRVQLHRTTKLASTSGRRSSFSAIYSRKAADILRFGKNPRRFLGFGVLASAAASCVSNSCSMNNREHSQ